VIGGSRRGFSVSRSAQLSPMALPLTVSASGCGSSPAFISSATRRDAAGVVEILAEIFARPAAG
jgi:hypothetical protein